MSTATDSTTTSSSSSTSSSGSTPRGASSTAASATETSTPLAVARAQRAAPRLAPAIDIYEVDGALVLLADVPGLAAGDLELTIERQLLTIRGTVRHAQPKGRLLHQEFGDVTYERSLSFDERIDAAGISATLSGGVLRIVVPTLPSAQPRRVPVTSAQAA